MSGVFDSQLHPSKVRLLAILRAVFGEDEVRAWSAPHAARQMGQVEEVLGGRGALFSRSEREAIEAAAARIQETP